MEEKRVDIGLLVLRVLAGGMMAVGHGWPKVLGFSMMSDKFPDPLGIGTMTSLLLAIFGELVCGALVVLGVKTRWTAVPVLVTMLVAGFIVHAGDPWGKKEFALVYAIPFLALIFTGGGCYSLDYLLESRRAKED